MWTSSIVGKEFRNGKQFVTVAYTNGADSFQETYEFSTAYADQLNGIIYQKISDLSAIDGENKVDAVSLGVFTASAPATALGLATSATL